MSLLSKARVKETASNRPTAGGTFNLPGSSATGYRSFDSAYATADTMPVYASNGTDWMEFLGTFTAGAPDTLSITTLYDSSTGSTIDWSTGADVSLGVNISAKQFNDLYQLYSSGLIPAPIETASRNAIKIAWFGDSKIGKNMYAPDSELYFSSIAGQGVWAEILALGLVQNEGYFGHPGYTSAQLTAVVAGDLAKTTAEYVVCFAGANDDQSLTYTERLSLLENLWQTIEGLGKKLIVATLTPHGGWGMKGNAISASINDYIVRKGREGRWRYADFCAAVSARTPPVIDNAGVLGWRSSSTLDGLHEAMPAAYYEAKEFLRTFLQFNYSSVNVNIKAYLQRNILTNPYVLTINPIMAGNNAIGAQGFDPEAGFSGTGPSWWRVLNEQSATITGSVGQSPLLEYETNSFNLSVTCGGGTYYPIDLYKEIQLYNVRANSENLWFGEYRLPAVDNGFIYKNIKWSTGTATTGSSPPTYSTVIGDSFNDGSVIWQTMARPVDGVTVVLKTLIIITAMSGSWEFKQGIYADAQGYTGTGKLNVMNGSEELSSGPGWLYSPKDADGSSVSAIPSDVIGKPLLITSQDLMLRKGAGNELKIFRQSFSMIGRTAAATISYSILSSELKVVV